MSVALPKKRTLVCDLVHALATVDFPDITRMPVEKLSQERRQFFHRGQKYNNCAFTSRGKQILLSSAINLEQTKTLASTRSSFHPYKRRLAQTQQKRLFGGRFCTVHGTTKNGPCNLPFSLSWTTGTQNFESPTRQMSRHLKISPFYPRDVYRSGPCIPGYKR